MNWLMLAINYLKIGVFKMHTDFIFMRVLCTMMSSHVAWARGRQSKELIWFSKEYFNKLDQWFSCCTVLWQREKRHCRSFSKLSTSPCKQFVKPWIQVMFDPIRSAIHEPSCAYNDNKVIMCLTCWFLFCYKHWPLFSIASEVPVQRVIWEVECLKCLCFKTGL